MTTSTRHGTHHRATALLTVHAFLFAAIVLDLQVPIMILSQPASVEHFEVDLGIPWFVVPLVFLVMIGVTVHCFLRRRREAAAV